jgi:hypothetical protein
MKTEAWRSSLYSCLAIGALMVAAGAVRHWRIPEHSFYVFFAAGALQLALGALLWARRARPSLAQAGAASVACTLLTLPAQWYSMSVFASMLEARPWTPFQGMKLLSILIALIGPEIPLVIVTDVLLLISSSLIQYLTFPAAVRAHFAFDEPGATLMYGGMALLLFYYRWRRHEAARQVARAEAQSASLQQLARVFLAVRDLTNTPLQTLQVCVELLARRIPRIGPELPRMQRSLARLRELDGILSRYESQVEWRDGESFDARRILADELPATSERN